MLSYFGGEGDEGVITRLMIVKKCEYWCVIWCVCVCLCVEMCVCVAMCLGKLVSFVSFCVCVNGCVIFCVFVFACVSLRLCVMCPGCSPWSERKSGVSVLFQRRKGLMSIHLCLRTGSWCLISSYTFYKHFTTHTISLGLSLILLN